jgi:hypothetical protein
MALPAKEEAPRPPDKINAVHVKVGVNMGDHGETVQNYIEVDETETIRSLLERTMPESKWQPRNYDHYIQLGFARPIEPEEDSDGSTAV